MPDYNSQQLALNRRRQIAQALQQESMLPIEQPQLPGANVSWTQGAAKLAQALFGGLINRKLDKQQTALDMEREAEKQAQLASLTGQMDPAIAQAIGSQSPVVSKLAQGLLENQLKTEADKQDRASALQRLAIQLSGQRAESDINRMTKAEEERQQRQFESEKLKQTQNFTAEQNAMARQNALDIANVRETPTPLRPPSATIDKVAPDGKIHIFRQNPNTGAYDIDEGLAPPKAATRDGLTDFQTNNTFLNISNKFQADPIMKTAVKGGTARAIADQVIANPTSAAEQMKSLYIFVKNLDPDSAVREGETALAKQTQSYFETFKASLTRLAQGQVLAPAAAKAMAEATKSLVTAWEDTAQKRTTQYQSQANVAGVGKQFEQYRKGFENPTSAGRDLKSMSTDDLLNELLKK